MGSLMLESAFTELLTKSIGDPCAGKQKFLTLKGFVLVDTTYGLEAYFITERVITFQ